MSVNSIKLFFMTFGKQKNILETIKKLFLLIKFAFFSM